VAKLRDCEVTLSVDGWSTLSSDPVIGVAIQCRKGVSFLFLIFMEVAPFPF